MKLYFKSLLNRLSNYNLKLNQESLFTDRIWAVVDEEGHQQTFIFEQNGDLVMSKNGKVTMGKWKFYPQAKSIRLDRGKGDQIFLNQAFFDKSIMVLKYDGNNNEDLFILADKNQIPDLDIVNYLKKLDYDNRQIKSIKLKSNEFLLIENGWNQKKLNDLAVTIDESIATDGIYFDVSEKYLFEISDSKIINQCNLTKYKLRDGGEIIIAQRIKGGYYNGDFVFSEDLKPLSDGTYKIGLFKKIKVREGKIFGA